jgi:hypothetical protein
VAERARRLFIEDARRNGRHLRTTWHPEGRQFVVSTWDADMVCTGAVRLTVEDAARLVSHVAGGLADGAAPPASPAMPTVAGPPPGILERLRRWLRRDGRGDLAPPDVVHLDERRSA